MNNCNTNAQESQENQSDVGRGLSSPHNGTQSPISPGVFSAEVRKRRAQATFYDGGSLVEVRRADRTRTNFKVSHVRGRIRGFSRASRRRLLRKLGKLERRTASKAYFVTLTYPDHFPRDPARWKADLKAWSERVRRRFPGAGFFWKLEIVDRKSGENEGESAPHFHILLWIGREVSVRRFRAWVSSTWYGVVASGDERHLRAGTQVQRARTWNGVMAYAAKYLSKEQVAPDLFPGRMWGVRGRQNLPWAAVLVVPLTDRRAVEIIRMMRRFSGVRSRAYRSLTIFADSSQWFDKLGPHIGTLTRG